MARPLLSFLATLALMIVSLSGCGDGGKSKTVVQPDPPVPASLTVSPPSASLEAIGDTLHLTGQVKDQYGHVMNSVSVGWASSAPSVAAVSTGGVVTSVSVGTATITGSVGGATGTSAISVTQVVSSVSVSPDTLFFFALGDTLRLTASVQDALGHEVADAAVVWTSSDESVATVDSGGQVKAEATGAATITAAEGGATGSSAVSVIQVVSALSVSPDTVTLSSIGATVQLTASALDALDHEVTAATVTWTSSDEAVVTVNQSGLLQAAAVGSAWIMADCGAQRDSVSVTVALPRPSSLLPLDWRMPIGEEVQFDAHFEGPGNEDAVWLVDNLPGGAPGIGQIDANGLYTAPGAIPAGGQVTIQARSATDPGVFMESVVTITDGSEQDRFLWHVWTPRAIAVGIDKTAAFEISFQGYPHFDVDRQGGAKLMPTPFRSGIYRLELEVSDLLSSYDQGDLHHFVGFLNCELCVNITRGNLFVNVKDATVPDVAIVPVNETIQAGSHIVNIRYDDPVIGGIIPTEVTGTFYDHFPDDFDFLGVIEQQNSPQNRFYRGLRNDTQGIGSFIFDQAVQYGSPSRLQGLISYPISTYYDAAERAAVHEIGHRWIMHLDDPIFAGNGAHWPLSSLARGMMGYSGAGGQGSSFPYEVQQVAGNIYKLVCSDRASEFNDLELYLMGLLPPDSVSTHVVFQNQSIPLACESQGATDPITIQEIIAVNGARVPDHGNSQKGFRFGTIILSSGRLLSPAEMAFFNHMAARGEATTELHFTSGFSEGTTKPFFLATGGRGTLSTRITH